MTIAGKLGGIALARFARIIAAPRVNLSQPLDTTPRVYYANHTSNADTVLIWASMPPSLRRKTRPVAAADYWYTSRLRRFIGDDIFNILPVDRNPETRTGDPIADMAGALDEGYSLILFPEGGRNETNDLLPFKTGIYHLAKTRPQTPFIPIWIDNLNGVMPRGEIIPVPLICTLTYGHPLTYQNEDKATFLERTRKALLDQRKDVP